MGYDEFCELLLIIEMRNVSWRRDGTYILRDINWNVEHGEHWAIVGLNGSGKTSLLNMINGYIFPSEGAVAVLGNKFGRCDLRELRKSIGWVSSSLQENLHTDDNAEEIVLSGRFASIGLYERPSTEDRVRASELLAQFGCEGFKHRAYSTLSQGEKQRVVLARALMNNPKILVLDEPCTGLDLLAREYFLKAITDIAAAGETPAMLYVSHHVEEILPIFNRTLLLRSGRIHSSGRTKLILTESNLTDFFQRRVELTWRNSRPRIHLDGM